MEQAYPTPENQPDALEGNAAHWVWREMLAGRMSPEHSIAYNGVSVTREMIEGAELYCDTLDAWGVPVESLHIEESMPIPLIHEQNGGTPDTWATPDVQTIRIRDYKFGHRWVEAVNNWQLINYASGILSKLGVNGLAEQHTRIIFEIVQPRSFRKDGPVREWSVMASDLRAQWNVLHSSAEQAMRPDAACFVNTECRDCSGRAFCPTLQRSALASVDESGRATPLELPPAALGLELRILTQAAEMIRARKVGLEEYALSVIRRGGAVPGWGTEQGKGRERWAKPLPEVLALGDMMGVALSKPDALTPKQAIKAGIPAEVVAAYVETPIGELKIVPDDGSLARRIFGESQ